MTKMNIGIMWTQFSPVTQGCVKLLWISEDIDVPLQSVFVFFVYFFVSGFSIKINLTLF